MRFSWIAGAATSAALMALLACEDRGTTGDKQPGTTSAPARDDTAAGRTDIGRTDTGAGSEAMQVARGVAMVRLLSEGEVEMGKLAADRAASIEVKAFAKKLVDDHTQMIQRADQLASSKKIDLSAARSDILLKAHEAESRQSLDRLKGLTGQAFDVHFISAQPGKHALLGALADAGEQAAQDGDIDGLFKTARDQARDHGAQAQAILPRECGGQGAALVIVAAGADQGTGAQPDAGQRGQRADTKGDTTGRARSGQGSTPSGGQTGTGTGTGTGTQNPR